MNRLLIALLICAMPMSLAAQQKMTVVAKGEATLEGSLPSEMIYAFDHFREATIVMNDGSENNTRVNIHLYTGDVLFFTPANQMLVLAYPLDVSHILIEGTRWRQIKGTFWEVKAENDDVILVSSGKTRMTNIRKETGFGGMSATSSVGRLTTLTQGKQIATVLPAGEYDFETSREYMLVRGNKTVIANAGAFRKYFPGKKREISAFIKERNIDFRNENDLLSLFEFSR